MFPKAFTARVREFTAALVGRTIGRTGLTPTDLTVAGLVLILGAAYLLATGELLWGGLLVAFASSFDMLDGALARARNEASRFGAFLDSTLDRYAEVCIFLGLLAYYWQRAPQATEVILIYIAVAGSLLVSYIRSRAESVGYDCKVGLLERPERIVLIVFGLVFNLLPLSLWVLAILTHVTALQRLVHVLRQARAEQPARPRRRWWSVERPLE